MTHFFHGLQSLGAGPASGSLTTLAFFKDVLHRALPLVAPAFFEDILCGAPSPLRARALSTEDITAALNPSCVSRVVLNKAVQSPSALLVSSELKPIAMLLW